MYRLGGESRIYLPKKSPYSKWSKFGPILYSDLYGPTTMSCALCTAGVILWINVCCQIVLDDDDDACGSISWMLQYMACAWPIAGRGWLQFIIYFSLPVFFFLPRLHAASRSEYFFFCFFFMFVSLPVTLCLHFNFHSLFPCNPLYVYYLFSFLFPSFSF